MTIFNGYVKFPRGHPNGGFQKFLGRAMCPVSRCDGQVIILGRFYDYCKGRPGSALDEVCL